MDVPCTGGYSMHMDVPCTGGYSTHMDVPCTGCYSTHIRAWLCRGASGPPSSCGHAVFAHRRLAASSFSRPLPALLFRPLQEWDYHLFRAELSSAGPDDLITNLNLPLLGVLETLHAMRCPKWLERWPGPCWLDGSMALVCGHTYLHRWASCAHKRRHDSDTGRMWQAPWGRPMSGRRRQRSHTRVASGS